MVAADEPDTEPKMPQASTFTCISRPGTRLSQGARPRNISSDSRVRNRISPIQMNSGSAASVHDALLPQTVVASTAPGGTAPPTNIMPAKPQAISAMAIHTPPASSIVSSSNRSSAISSRATSDPALRLRRRVSQSDTRVRRSVYERPKQAIHAQTPLCTARSTTSSAVCGLGFS